MNAQPYLEPALDMHLKELPDNVKTSIERGGK